MRGFLSVFREKKKIKWSLIKIIVHCNYYLFAEITKGSQNFAIKLVKSYKIDQKTDNNNIFNKTILLEKKRQIISIIQ